MEFWGRRLGWQPLLCIDVGDNLHFYELRSLRRTRRGFCVDERSQEVENLLTLAVRRRKRDR
jgi:hypothetical protein